MTSNVGPQLLGRRGLGHCPKSPGTHYPATFHAVDEYKHILDHGRTCALYQGKGQRTAEQQGEQAANYFAGCALIPRTALKRAWTQGLQRSRDLAQYFDVSRRAIEVRLAQIGLSDDSYRCLPPPRERQEEAEVRTHRHLSITWITPTEPEYA